MGNAAFEVYAIGVFIASLGSILLGAFSWFGAKREYARPFSLMQFAIFVWCFFGYSQLRVSGLGEQVAYLKLEYIGIASLPVAALAFARSLARRPLSGRTALLLLALPALTVLLVAVGGEPGLVWTPVGQDAKGRLLTEAGPWFWVHSAYSYVLVTACFANLVARAREVQGSTRRWLRHSIAILLIPVFTNLVFVLFFLKTTPLDPTPMAFALSGLLLAIGLRNYNIFDLVPYAKEAILAAIDNPILTVDADRLVVGANAPALALFAGLGAIEGRPLSALAGEDAGSALLAAAEASLREGGAREWRLRDRYYHLVSFALPTALGTGRDFILIFYDETERTRALLALEERERALERYASMVNASHEFMSNVGRDLRYEAVNDAFCERYGKCRDDILGATVFEVWGEEAARKYILPYLESCFAGEYKVIRNRFAFVGEEKERHFEVSYNPVRDASGEVTHAVVITKDVGDYVEAQEALAVAREKADAANAAKSSFLAAMSHEIRTPLNAIIGLTELSLRAPLSAEQRDNLETVRMAGGTLLNIINDILDLSKIEAGRMTLERVDFDLPAHLAQVLKTFKPAFARKGLYLEFEAAPGSPRFVAGDSLRLGQVLMNLVGNAVKFTEKGGVKVRLEAEAAGEGKAGIRVSVADTGIGIPRDKLDLIFESFSQADSSVSRRYGGTGLGLSICRNLVGLFGGRIWVESEPGKGSTFSFTAFLEPGDEAKAAARVRPGEGEGEASGGGPFDILLAEDNLINAKVALRWLEQAGHRARHAVSGAEAIRALAERPFDLVLMDVEMPDIDGLEAARRVRGGAAGLDRRSVPIIAMTAHDDQAMREACARAGMDDYVTKPVDFVELAGALARVARPSTREAAAKAPALVAASGEPLAAAPLLDEAEPLRRLGGDGDLYLELISIFAAEARGRREALEAALAARESETLRRLAHSLRGGARTIGAEPLAAAAAALEKAAGEADTSEAGAASALPGLERLLAAALVLLDSTARRIGQRLPPGYEAPQPE